MKHYQQYDQCPICGEKLIINKKDSHRLLCECCGFNVSSKVKSTHDDVERLKTAYDSLRSYDFERAESKYNLILDDDSDNNEICAAALFGKILTEFGIIYVKDINNVMIPTFSEYNPSVNSIKESDTYKRLLSLNCDENIKKEYIDKLEELDKVYKRIGKELKSNSEYDVFICAKITCKTPQQPESKGYTEDSKKALSFYEELTREGLKVFYSDKCCGQIEYDSQILSALLKSRKMLVIATEKEYLESPWVQSEWRRWLNLIECGIKTKDSLVLYLPYDKKFHFELPRPLRKVQYFSDEIQIERLFVNDVINGQSINKLNPKEIDKEDEKDDYELGKKCYDDKNYSKALDYFEKAAKKNHRDALFYLGFSYGNGYGCSKNYKKAFECYLKASELGSIAAQNNLGVCYEQGDGCDRNLFQAFCWYKKAAENGDDVAQYNLAICYERGDGCEKNLEQAFHWYKKSADQGYSKAQYNLALCYKNGHGCEQNLFEAFRWYKEAAENGNLSAQNSLGFCYEHGDGCDQNLFQAFCWYKKAAENGDDVAQYNLAICYENGYGCKKNIKLAMKWYTESYHNGYSKALTSLEKLKEKSKKRNITIIISSIFITLLMILIVLFMTKVFCFHIYEKSTVLPTCTENGVTTYTCKNCDHTYEKILYKLGSSIVVDAAVNPTCTEPGLTEGSHCSRCDYTIAQTVIAALGHDFAFSEKIEPTCTEPGMTSGIYCKKCNYFEKGEVIDAMGHKYEEREYKPTFFKSGFVGFECSCGDRQGQQTKSIFSENIVTIIMFMIYVVISLIIALVFTQNYWDESIIVVIVIGIIPTVINVIFFMKDQVLMSIFLGVFIIVTSAINCSIINEDEDTFIPVLILSIVFYILLLIAVLTWIWWLSLIIGAVVYFILYIILTSIYNF